MTQLTSILCNKRLRTRSGKNNNNKLNKIMFDI